MNIISCRSFNFFKNMKYISKYSLNPLLQKQTPKHTLNICCVMMKEKCWTNTTFGFKQVSIGNNKIKFVFLHVFPDCTSVYFAL